MLSQVQLLLGENNGVETKEHLTPMAKKEVTRSGMEATLEQHLEGTMKNPSIVGVLCTDSQGLNLGCKYLTSSLLVDCIALDVD